MYDVFHDTSRKKQINKNNINLKHKTTLIVLKRRQNHELDWRPGAVGAVERVVCRTLKWISVL